VQPSQAYSRSLHIPMFLWCYRLRYRWLGSWWPLKILYFHSAPQGWLHFRYCTVFFCTNHPFYCIKVKVNDATPPNVPYYQDGIRIRFEGAAILVEIPEIRLELSYYIDFPQVTIHIPMSTMFNETVGLCGEHYYFSSILSVLLYSFWSGLLLSMFCDNAFG